MTEFYSKYRTGKPDFKMGAKGDGVPAAKVDEEVLENLDGLRDPKTRDRQSTK